MSTEQNAANEPITLSHTVRGFEVLRFLDHYGAPCSLQKSSLASEDAIWLGCDDANPKIMAVQAAKHGVDTDQRTGWVTYPIPKDVSLNTRMHLTQEQVRALLPFLQHFAETGNISDAARSGFTASERDEKQGDAPQVLTYRELVAQRLDAGEADAETQRHAAHMLRERAEQREPVSAFDPFDLEDMARSAFEEALAFGISTDSFVRLAKRVATAIPVENELAVAGWETVFPSPELAAKYGTTVIVQQHRPTPPYSSTQPLCRIVDAVRMIAQRDDEIRELSETARQNWAYVQIVDNYMAQHSLLELVHENGGGREAGLNVVAGIEKLRVQCAAKGTPEERT